MVIGKSGVHAPAQTSFSYLWDVYFQWRLLIQLTVQNFPSAEKVILIENKQPLFTKNREKQSNTLSKIVRIRLNLNFDAETFKWVMKYESLLHEDRALSCVLRPPNGYCYVDSERSRSGRLYQPRWITTGENGVELGWEYCEHLGRCGGWYEAPRLWGYDGAVWCLYAVDEDWTQAALFVSRSPMCTPRHSGSSFLI